MSWIPQFLDWLGHSGEEPTAPEDGMAQIVKLVALSAVADIHRLHQLDAERQQDASPSASTDDAPSPSPGA